MTFLHEMLGPGPLFGAGATFLFLGWLFHYFPKLYTRSFTLRKKYAQQLRESGEMERADRIDAETARILYITPRCGRLFIVGGVVVFVLAIIAIF